MQLSLHVNVVSCTTNPGTEISHWPVRGMQLSSHAKFVYCMNHGNEIPNWRMNEQFGCLELSM